MDENDETIVREYQAVLKKVSPKPMFGVPQELLGYTKKKIRQAIKDILTLECVKYPRDKDLIKRLKSDYAALAQFVSYEEFGLKREMYEQGMAVFFQKALQKEKNEALKITAHIRREEAALADEINHFCQDFRI